MIGGIDDDGRLRALRTLTAQKLAWVLLAAGTALAATGLIGGSGDAEGAGRMRALAGCGVGWIALAAWVLVTGKARGRDWRAAMRASMVTSLATLALGPLGSALNGREGGAALVTTIASTLATALAVAMSGMMMAEVTRFPKGRRGAAPGDEA